MVTQSTDDFRRLFRRSAFLRVAGRELFIAKTVLHAGGDANDHPAISAAYARSETWTSMHLGQFAAVGLLSAGLLAFLDTSEQAGRRPYAAGGAGRAFVIVALALYGALQAADGVALKRAVTAWASSPESEQAARFASAKAIRWLEWGLHSYHDFAFGLALLMCAVAALAVIGRLAALVIALSGAAYPAKGWFAETEGFSPAQPVAIVAGWALNILWMAGLSVSPPGAANAVEGSGQ